MGHFKSEVFFSCGQQFCEDASVLNEIKEACKSPYEFFFFIYKYLGYLLKGKVPNKICLE